MASTASAPYAPPSNGLAPFIDGDRFQLQLIARLNDHGALTPRHSSRANGAPRAAPPLTEDRLRLPSRTYPPHLLKAKPFSGRTSEPVRPLDYELR